MTRLWKRSDDLKITKSLTIGTNAKFINDGAVLERVQTIITTKTILASESGSTFIFSLAGGFTATLPLPASGLNYKVIIGINPTTSYFLLTNAGADIMAGGINELEVDTGSDGPSDLNADSIEFTAAAATVGDYVNLTCDGTTWFFDGQTALDAGIVLSTT